MGGGSEEKEGGGASAIEDGTPGDAGVADSCLNCGAPLIGEYCHACGQQAHVHRTLRAFGHDLAHGALHFEGKIWRTLPLLAWRPGELSRRYIHGERAKFVSPIALFLFSVFLMFAVFTTVGGPFSIDGTPAQAEVARDLARETAALDREIARLEQERQALRARNSPTAEVDGRIAEARGELRSVAAMRNMTGGPGSPEGDAATTGIVFDDGEMNIDTGWPAFDTAVAKAAKNPSLLAYKLQANAYKFSWALIPISVPFVALLFLWRRRHKAYDHVVFVTYSIAAMTLLLVILSLLRPLFGGAALTGLVLTFVPPVHMYRQLRGTYELGWFSALWRTFALLIFASIAATLFLLLLLAIGVLG